MSTHTATVESLTSTWTRVLSPSETGLPGYTPIEYDPLLDMLRAAIHSSTGGTSAGRSDAAARSLINIAAFDLWDRIDSTTRAWISDLATDRPAKELKEAVQQLARIAENEWKGNRMTDALHARIFNLFESWKNDIWAIFDPPVTKEIQAECPNCAERHFFDQEGTRTSAVVAFYWKGATPQAQCRRCAKSWVGERDLLELGFSIRANVDVDTLREMGVAI